MLSDYYKSTFNNELQHLKLIPFLDFLAEFPLFLYLFADL